MFEFLIFYAIVSTSLLFILVFFIVMFYKQKCILYDKYTSSVASHSDTRKAREKLAIELETLQKHDEAYESLKKVNEDLKQKLNIVNIDAITWKNIVDKEIPKLNEERSQLIEKLKDKQLEESKVDSDKLKEFQDAGLLWWVNTLLHTFGWSIAYGQDNNTSVVKQVYISKYPWRGFSEEANTQGYMKVTKYMKENAEKLLEDFDLDHEIFKEKE